MVQDFWTINSRFIGKKQAMFSGGTHPNIMLITVISIILIAFARVHVTYLMTVFVPMCSGNSHHDEMANRPYLYHKLSTSYSMEGHETYNNVGYGSVPTHPKVLKAIIRYFHLMLFEGWIIHQSTTKNPRWNKHLDEFHEILPSWSEEKSFNRISAYDQYNTISSIGTRVQTAFTKQNRGFVDLNS